MKKSFFIYLSICICIISNAQNPELVIQNGHVSDIIKIGFNNDGYYLASLAENNEIILWDVRSGGQIIKIKPEQKIIAFTFNDNNTQLILGSNDGSLLIYDIINSRIKNIINLNELIKPVLSIKSINSLKFIDTETLIIDSETDYSLNINTHAFSAIPDAEIDNKKKTIFNKSKNEAIIRGSQINVQDRNSGNNIFSVRSIYLSKKFNSISASDTNQLIIAANELGGIYIIDYKGKIKTILEEHLRSVNDVTFSPDETLFASASSDRSIIIWDVRNLKPIKRFYSRTLPIKKIAFTKDGSMLAIGDALGFIKIIDLSSNGFDLVYRRQHEQEITSINFLPGDSMIMTTASDNKAYVYNVRDLTPNKKLNITRNLNFKILKEKVDKLYSNKMPSSRLFSSIITSDSNYLILAGLTPRYGGIRNPFFPLTLINLKTLRKDYSLFYKYKLPEEAYKFRSSISCLKPALKKNEFYNSTGNILNHWIIKDKNVYYKSYTVAEYNIEKFEFIDNETILFLANGNLYTFDFIEPSIVNSVTDSITNFFIDRKTKKIAIVNKKNQIIIFKDFLSKSKITTLPLTNNKVNDIAFHPIKPWLISAHDDGSINFWNINDGLLEFTIIPVDENQKVIITPEDYYYSPRASVSGIGFKQKNRFITFDQLDLQYNRPDIILSKLGYADSNLLTLYKNAYHKRLRKYELDEKFSMADLVFPEIKIIDKQRIPLNTKNSELEFNVIACDSVYKLTQLNLYINNVPYFGGNGINLNTEANDTLKYDFKIPLADGENKIEVSCRNSQGIESFRDNFNINCEIEDSEPHFYFIPICVSKYKQDKFNLEYTVKDGVDMQNMFKNADDNYQIHLDNYLFDSVATRENILGLKNKLLNTNVNDIVMLYVSGHGLLDKNFDFYFATHDIDFNNPSERGISYEELEWLLDSIPARKKLFLMDACHSGEVDKDELRKGKGEKKKGAKSGVKIYTYRANILQNDEIQGIGLQNSFELMQELFSNLNRGSGTVVISAAAGDSYAMESDEWQNGVFTYSILNGLQSGDADINNDGEITVSELRTYVSKSVQELTNGLQKPTMRQENVEFDFRLW